MIGLTEKLTILHYDGATYSDYSDILLSYLSEDVSISLAPTDKFYVGFKKPINTVFVEVHTAHNIDTTLSVKYYNGAAFDDVLGLLDDSGSFDHSGFIQWDRNQDSESKTAIDGVEQFWYELTVADSITKTLDGLNIVFSDDNDLKLECFEITDYYPEGRHSHILSHVASRNFIIQKLRTDGRYKLDLSNGNLKDITAFDLLDVSQVRMASTFLTLSKIFTNLSDESEDVYSQKATHYMSLFGEVMQHFFLYLDTDDDGTLDTDERTMNVSSVLVRR